MRHLIALSITLLLSFSLIFSYAEPALTKASESIYDSIVRSSGNSPRYTHTNSPDQTTQIKTYFESAIDASNIKYDGKQLSYQLRECAQYGETAITGLQQEACVNTRINIILANLEIVTATKGVFLLKKQRLEVKGDIKRELLNINLLSKEKADHVRAQFKANPESINIPVNSSYDPKQIAKRLKL